MVIYLYILVYAFDVLYQIYLSVGYSEREIPRLILEKNIYGLDIDDRAGQLAYFALMMKARSYSRRIFRDMERNPISLNICSIQESNGLTKEDIEYFANGDESLKKDIEYLVEVFTDAKEYGSILEVNEVDFDKIENRLRDIENEIVDLFKREIRASISYKLPKLIQQAKLLSKKYYICVTNPPYMGSKGINNLLRAYLNKNYDEVKMDLFSVFMVRNFKYTMKNGYLGYMTPFTWMFISTYKSLRENIIKNKLITSLIQLEYSAFTEATVPICVFTLRNNNDVSIKGTYIRLSEFKGANIQPIKVLESLKKEVDYKYNINQEYFLEIPNNPIAYWMSDEVIEIFKHNKSLSSYANCKSGIMTGSDSLFLRLWHEVEYSDIKFDCSEYNDMIGFKWFPINKGGEFRKYYGNNEYIVDLENEGENIKKYSPNYRLRDGKYYFKLGLNWSRITSSKISFRMIKPGTLFADAAPAGFIENEKLLKYMLGLLNSKCILKIAQFINPTLNYQVNDINNIPIVLEESNILIENICNIVSKCIYISKLDWDSFETSWDFKKHPIIEFKSNNIENSFNNWSEFTEKQFNQLKANEEELNRIFIDIYGLQDELTPEVDDKDITIRKADRERDIKSLISYAVGCMMGRYSLDEEGLAFAGVDFDINKYKTFKADEDAIIPITDAEYLRYKITYIVCSRMYDGKILFR